MSRHKRLIAITGKARSGKDTLGNHLMLVNGFHRMAFADPLKEAMAATFGVAVDEFHCDKLKDAVHSDWQMTRRAMLQQGADALRGKFGQDLFIKRWLHAYRHVADTEDVVITDLRSNAEAQIVRDLGGSVICIEREGAGLSGEEAQHHTETGVCQTLIDRRIINNGTKRELWEQMLQHLQEVKCK